MPTPLPGPRAHQRGTRALLTALFGAPPAVLDPLWAQPLPEEAPPGQAGFKYDLYLTEGERPGWGIAYNARWADPAAERDALAAALGPTYDWARAERFVAHLDGAQTLALGFSAGPPRVKLYRQEEPWGAGLTDGPGLAALGQSLDLPLPAWVAELGPIGVVTLELRADGTCALKAYLGAPSPHTLADRAPDLLPAMAQCTEAGAWFYLTLRFDPQGVRTALNKIYNPQEDDPAAAWADVARLFAAAGANLDRLRQRCPPGLELRPTATAVEAGGRQVDVYVAAFQRPVAPALVDDPQIHAILTAWCAEHTDFVPRPIEAEGAARVVAAGGPRGDLRLRLRAQSPVEVLADIGLPALAASLAAALTPALAALPAGDKADHARRVELFTVDGCSLACAFCCESTRIAQKRLLPTATVQARLREAAAQGVGVVQFMGGEASLHPDFVDHLRTAKGLGLSTYTITNLLRWEDRAFAEAVAPLLDEVMVSVHAASAQTGALITGRSSWWSRFCVAHKHAVSTLQGRVRASTVLTVHTLPELDAIADLVAALRPQAWIFGSPVPVAAARADALELGLSLTQWRALRPRLEALSTRMAAQGCRLVFFCVPPCVLGPMLADDTHDELIDGQDLSDGAAASDEMTFFWSQADFLSEGRPVTLARRRGLACQSCQRRDRCGGYFAAYLDRHGEGELEPYQR